MTENSIKHLIPVYLGEKGPTTEEWIPMTDEEEMQAAATSKNRKNDPMFRIFAKLQEAHRKGEKVESNEDLARTIKALEEECYKDQQDQLQTLHDLHARYKEAGVDLPDDWLTKRCQLEEKGKQPRSSEEDELEEGEIEEETKKITADERRMLKLQRKKKFYGTDDVTTELSQEMDLEHTTDQLVAEASREKTDQCPKPEVESRRSGRGIDNYLM
jgi:hypothetical protein